MDHSKLPATCIVCHLNTSSLSALHNHQSIHHTSEELSLCILTLQSFLYHKHFFQNLDAQPSSDICHFYPFCTQLFSNKGKNLEENSQTFCPIPPWHDEPLPLKIPCQDTELISAPESMRRKKKSPKKQMPLRLPLAGTTRPTIIKSLNSLAKQSSPLTNTTTSLSDSHAAFVNSANGLCNDLIKLNGPSAQSKIKRKRLNDRRDRPRIAKRDNKQMVKKPPRKPKMADVGMTIQKILPKISSPDQPETVKIWASKSDESVSLSSPNNTAEGVQPINIQSPIVPIDIMNCENALIFDSETGSFQWNPVVFVEKTEEDVDAFQAGEEPESILPNEITHVSDNC